ncbi:MAG TPA: RDD family protein [Phototrophicaceae bacterium]|nr:RDD family protein [Phototrophicaceae bacterium]
MSTYPDPYEKPKRDVASGELADTGTRFVALIIDGIILGIITGVLTRTGLAVGGVASFVVGIIYQWYFLTQNNGQTPGKRVMGIRVVKVNGEPLQAADVIVRYVGYYIDSIVFMIGWLWALIDRDRQCWHDKLAGTFVVRA